MGKLFGTDGIRGVVGVDLTAELAFRTGQALSFVLREELGHRPVITIGKDTRISSDMLESALIAGICSAGGDAMPFGVLPTPAVAYLTVRRGADAGVVISASHNPFAYNGIKVFSGEGYKLGDKTEERIEAAILSPDPIPVMTGGEIGILRHGIKLAREEYIHHLTTSVEHDLAGLRILVDCANGAAASTAPELFGRFKCRADFISREPNGVNINNDCGSTHLAALASRVVSGRYDIGVAFDGDADRCLLVDERGETIDGDRVIAVCAQAFRREGRLHGNAVVATVMSNLGLHEFCRNSGIELVCTAVGDRNVLEKMREHGYCIGGEQSGHTIFTDYATTGDGQLSALQFLQILARSGKSASELADICAVYPQVLLNVELPHERGVKERIMSSHVLAEAIAKQENFLRGEGRILVRPSGTEALIRVMAEAKTEAIARHTAEQLAELIKTL